jgi:AmiR/NasT family two-component response regulator
MSAQLDQTVKMANTAWQEANTLKKELGQLKKKLKEKEDNLRNSVKALVGNLLQ